MHSIIQWRERKSTTKAQREEENPISEKGAAVFDFEFCASSLSLFLVFLPKSNLVPFRMLKFVVGTFFRKESARKKLLPKSNTR
jgi:hypothetical protein